MLAFMVSDQRDAGLKRGLNATRYHRADSGDRKKKQGGNTTLPSSDSEIFGRRHLSKDSAANYMSFSNSVNLAPCRPRRNSISSSPQRKRNDFPVHLFNAAFELIRDLILRRPDTYYKCSLHDQDQSKLVRQI